MNERPTVDYPILLGRLFGLCQMRHVISREQFDVQYADIQAEFNAQTRAVSEFWRRDAAEGGKSSEIEQKRH